MPNYTLNYIYIDQRNVKTFGIIRPSENEATDIEVVKQLVASNKRSPILTSVQMLEPGSIFYLNLMMVDSEFPKILEAAIRITEHHKKLSSADLCKKLKEIDPLGLQLDHEHTIYNHKWKQFLLALGSGMGKDDVWTNKFEGIEHHAIFKQQPNELIPDFFYPAPFAEYLFLNTFVLCLATGFEIQLS